MLASVLTSAMAAEGRPAHRVALAQAGHEIVAHGYAQNDLMHVLEAGSTAFF
ncbi:MAG: hypothetical protein JJU21_13205 [Salinarimonas sp.]|nr:hypothetical protein [Salinarimonas sp.]